MSDKCECTSSVMYLAKNLCKYRTSLAGVEAVGFGVHLSWGARRPLGLGLLKF